MLRHYPSMKKFVKLTSYFLILLSIFSCRKNLEGPKWDTEILTPIIKTELKIQNLVDSSEFLQTTTDHQLAIVYSNDVYSLETPLSSLVELSIDPFEDIFTIDNLELGNQKIQDSIKLGDIPLPSGISIGDGGEVPIALFNFLTNLAGTAGRLELPTSTNEVDISTFLVEAVLSQAFLDVTIENSTDFDINDLSYEIRNKVGGQLLVSAVIPTIPAGTTYENLNQDLIAQIGSNPVRGELEIVIQSANITIPAGEPSVTFNFADFIAFDATLRDIKVINADAIFPPQEIVNSVDLTDLITEGDVELTFVKVDTGIVNLQAFSSFPTDVEFDYEIPNLEKDGNTFSFSSVIDNSFTSSLNRKDTNFFFNEFDFTLSATDGTTFKNANAFLSKTIGRLRATPGIVNISLDDTLGVKIDVTKIVPSYARGYLGRDTTNVVDTISIDLINGLSGNLNFENVDLELSVDNQLGIDAIVVINSLVSKNTKTGQQVTYSGSQGPYPILPATENGNTFNTTNSVIQISDAEALVNILPDQFIFDLDIIINPIGNDGSYSNFIHSNASIFSKLNLNIPLEISSASVSLQDTVELTGGSLASSSNIIVPEEFKGGTLSFLVENGFPLDAEIKIFFLNDAGFTIDSLVSSQKVEAGVIDNTTGLVTARTKSRLDFPDIDAFRINAMLSATKIVFVSNLETTGNNPIKILDTYGMDIQLVGDFGYTIKN